MKRPAVFLDRDGTLIEETGYLDRLERLRFFPYSLDAVRQLNRAGLLVVVVTNQAGVARGIVRESFVAEAHAHIAEAAAAGGARIDAFYYCPHHPDGIVPGLRRTCECRKPQSGLFRQAAADLDIGLPRSYAAGDRWHDVQAGASVGAQTVLVRTGYGKEVEGRPPEGIRADAVVDNLAAAAAWILARSR